MAVATLTAKGQIVIPADIRARHELTPGTQVEFVDEGGVIRLLVRRRIKASDPGEGYGLIRIQRAASSAPPRKLSDFDPAALLKPSPPRKLNTPNKPSKARK
jgi:AbrB family looped-hinge helix DNA binding protein